MVQVVATRINENSFPLKGKEQLLSKLPDAATHRILQYTRHIDFTRTLAGELLIRYIIHKKLKVPFHSIQLTFSNKGKPAIDNKYNFCFNISHSGNYIVAAYSEKEIGIDVELIEKGKLKIAKRFFSPEEYEYVMMAENMERIQRFFEIWTMKESYLKLKGKGLTQSLRSFSVVNTKNQFKIKEGKEILPLYLKQFDIDPAYRLSVCYQEESISNEIVVIDINTLTSFL